MCDEVIEDTFNSLIYDGAKVCKLCIDKFKVRNKKIVVENVECEILYYYDEYFKQLLFQYKGLGNYLLKDVFLYNNLKRLKKKYKGYTLVLAPSNDFVEIKRGFCHLEGICESLNLKMIKCFSKSQEWKQSDKKLSERKDIQNIIKIDKSLLNGVKRVLIVDDVLTSGSTIKTMISQMPSNIDKKVLVLSSNCQFLPNEIV